jgi:1-deoxy-D-xylulose-5-phosphate synthase
MDVLYRHGAEGVLLVGIGAMASLGLEVAERLTGQGIAVTVVDPRWVIPVSAALVGLAAQHLLVVTIEDNGRVGGVGSAVAQALRDAEVATPLQDFGLPRRFLEHGRRAAVLRDCGLSAQPISLAIIERMARSGALDGHGHVARDKTAKDQAARRAIR